MSKYKEKPKAIAILGMHRSGTSTIARAINILGVYLGEEEDMARPMPDNPKGFWERDDIKEINERIFKCYKRSWDATIPMPHNWHLSAQARPFRDEIITLVKEKFSGRKLWAWKDPRASLTFELWKELLKDMKMEVEVLFALRNPLDVARSLEKRNNFPHDKSFGIWFNYNLAALLASADIPRVFISYDGFLEDWEAELKRCAKGLDINWPEDEARLKEKMNSFIRPGLRHSKSGTEELEVTGAPRPLIELYALMTELMDNKITTKKFNTEVKKLAAEFSEYTRFFQQDMADLWDVMPRLREEEHRLEATLNSWSWKITAPLRDGLDMIYTIKKDKKRN